MTGMQKKLLFIWILLYFLVYNGNSERLPKLINGQFGKASDFKYIVTVVRDSSPACGGGIVGNRFILTAAHCVYDIQKKIFRAKKYEILAATNSWNDTKTAIRIGVESVYVPEKFAKGSQADADIAVLKLKSSLEVEKNLNKLQFLHLPKDGLGQFENMRNYEITYAGFGRGEVSELKMINGKLTYETSQSGWLRFAKARIIKLDECHKYWSKSDVTENNLCLRIIQDPTGKKYQGTCRGDSGGPLVVNNVLVGVDSASDDLCNSNTRPSVFTRVSSFLSFINNAMTGSISEVVVYHSRNY